MMRELERGMFEKTKQWLKDDSSRVFTLVVDELHAYRGDTRNRSRLFILRLLLERNRPDTGVSAIKDHRHVSQY